MCRFDVFLSVVIKIFMTAVKLSLIKKFCQMFESYQKCVFLMTTVRSEILIVFC